MATQTADLWKLVWGQPYIEPTKLAAAVKEQSAEPSLDYRTRLLIRDSVQALRDYWGPTKTLERLGDSPQIESICKENLGDAGFPSIRVRLMERTDPAVVRELFRNLGSKVHKPLKLVVGGSIALILPDLLPRVTDAIDVPDELPEEIRNQHKLLDQFPKLYGLRLTHFQSHYLPPGWESRLHFLDTFAELTVYLVDPCDVWLSKLTSRREKDMADLRVVLPKLQKQVLVDRLKNSAWVSRLPADDKKNAEQNWYILFGESLPT